MVLVEHPRWCDDLGCLAAVFQSIPEGMRLISDFPSLRLPLFLSWERRFGWRSIYAAKPLTRAPVLHFAGRGYFRYPRARERAGGSPHEKRGEWLSFDDASSQAIARLSGELRFVRDYYLFRSCGGAWNFVLDATPYGLTDAIDEAGLEKERRMEIVVEASPRRHPERCEPCQAFSSSLTVFRVAAPDKTPLCSPGAR